MQLNPFLICYDITDDKTRKKIFTIMKSWRIDGQKSVHECRLSPQSAQELFIQLNEFINQKTDRLLFAQLEQNRSILTRGIGKNVVNRKDWYISLN